MNVPHKLSGQLARIEVHAGSTAEEAREAGVTWIVQATHESEGLLLTGYVRRAGAEGFGQAQAVAWVNRPSPVLSLAEEHLDLWLREYVTENVYDTCRYALQAQAAAMDFQFEIPASAPDLETITFAQGSSNPVGDGAVSDGA